MRHRLLLACLGLALVACSPAASATPAPAASAAPSDAAVGHAAPELEALLPAAIDGTALSSVSGTGPDVFGGDAFSQSMMSFLLSNDLTSADFRFAQAWDPSEALALELGDFEVSGIDPTTLSTAIVEATRPNAPGLTAEPATLGGRDVTAVMYPSGGPTLYLYPGDGRLFYVGTADPELGARVIGLLR
jgi:hypothetical protein